MSFLNKQAEEEYIKQCEDMRYQLAYAGAEREVLLQRYAELKKLKAAVEQVMQDLRSAGLYEYSDRLREILKGGSE